MPGQPTFVNPTRDPLLPAGIGIGLDRSQPLEVEFTFVTGGGGGVQDLAAPTQWLTTELQNRDISSNDRGFATFGDKIALGEIFSSSVGGVFNERQVRIFNAGGSLDRTVRPAGSLVFGVTRGMAYLDEDTMFGTVQNRGVFAAQNWGTLNLVTGAVTSSGSAANGLPQVLNTRMMDGIGDDIYYVPVSEGNRVFHYRFSTNTATEFISDLDGVVVNLSVSGDRIALRTGSVQGSTLSGSPNMIQFFDRATGEERSENNVLFEQVSGVDFSDFAISETSIYYRQTPNVAVPRTSFRYTATWWSQLRPTGEFTAWSIRRSVNAGSSWQYWSGTNWSGAATTELPVADLVMTGCVAERVGVTCWRTSVDPWTSGSGTHLFQVRTKDTRASIWSDSLTILPDSPLTIGVTVPADGADLSEAYVPQWTVNRVGSYYRVQSYLDGVLVQSSGLVTSQATRHDWLGSGRDQIVGLIDAPEVPDGASLRVIIEVWSTRFLRSEAAVSGIVRYLPPFPPDNVQVLSSQDDGYIRVEWTALGASAGRPNPATIEVWRREVERRDATEVLIARRDDVAVGSRAMHDDYWCPFGRELEYRVVTVGGRDQHDPDIVWHR